MNAVKDGASNTFLFAEAAQPIAWARPGDMAIRAGQPLPLPGEQFNVCFTDGSVRMIWRSSVADNILRQAIDPNDGGRAGGLD